MWERVTTRLEVSKLMKWNITFLIFNLKKLLLVSIKMFTFWNSGMVHTFHYHIQTHEICYILLYFDATFWLHKRWNLRWPWRNTLACKYPRILFEHKGAWNITLKQLNPKAIKYCLVCLSKHSTQTIQVFNILGWFFTLRRFKFMQCCQSWES